MSTLTKIKDIVNVDILKQGQEASTFVGRPFYLDYNKAFILISDYWKQTVGGIPHGTFLLAFYDNEQDVSEALLLRALRPTKLPTDNDVISSMIEYYKDNLKTSGEKNQLDSLTRYEFSWSGLECRILGTFYKIKGNNGSDIIEFGADVENFYSANNYSVYKPESDVLKHIVNQRDEDQIIGSENEFEIGNVRYSSSRRFNVTTDKKVSVYINPEDFLGKRTALFGMTRTGKSNTVKKIIEATVEISNKAPEANLPDEPFQNNLAENLEPFNKKGSPKYPVGQIIFDINGEYANPNFQDEGTAIYELYSEDVIRYSVIEKEGFKVLKVNFYEDIEAGFELIRSHLSEMSGDYISSVAAIDLSPPEDKEDKSAMTRYERQVAAYLCCLYQAGFIPPSNFKVKFQGRKELNEMVRPDGSLDPKKGLSLEKASDWFSTIWDNYNDEFFSKYKRDHDGREWADEDLKSLLVFLTRKRSPGGNANISGFRKLHGIRDLHTPTVDKPFQDEILEQLLSGKIVIIDLSQGNPEIQKLYSERICKAIFNNSMDRFIKNKPNNFVQFYFEEAHNLFPKKEEKDLSQIYNRIAKEGAKLNIGLIYLTQEVSSISANILKNTQNWFIAHLNNEDELKELKKYYDFSDFTDSLVRFSAKNDKGFVRMKTYSNPFVVPVQIHRFLANRG